MHARLTGALTSVFLLLTIGCAPKAPQTYRLMPKALVPPGVMGPDIPRRTVTIEAPDGGGKCTAAAAPIVVKRSGTKLRLTMAPSDFADKPAGWLRVWAVERESEGCVAAGSGLKLAQAMVESLPLDPALAVRLLRMPFVASLASFVDLGPENRIQIDSPVFKEGTPEDAPVLDTVNVSQGANPMALTVQLKTTDAVIGFETAWYTIRPKSSAKGFEIVPLYADRHVAGEVQRRPEPHLNPFHFRAEAAYYRMYYRGDRTIIVASAATPAELESETKALRQDGTACNTFPAGACVLLPNNMGANPHVVVKVNGTELFLPLNSAVRSAITASKAKPEDVLPHLTVRKPYSGRLAAVQFDATKTDILNLPLVGGEEISWQ